MVQKEADNSGVAKMKGYKVVDAERKFARVGIAANTLEDLRMKTRKKFETTWKAIKPSEDFYLQLTDGTKIETEEYFQTLPSQVTVVWVECGKTAETDAARLLRVIKEVNQEYLNAGKKVENFLADELRTNVYKLAVVLENLDESKVLLSTRTEDPKWFEGLDTRSKTKEEYLYRRSQDRIRSYFYKAKEGLMKYQSTEILKLISYLQTQLKQHKYFGCYFDRSLKTQLDGNKDTKLKCLCYDTKGKFICQGLWNQDKCLSIPKHEINPYSSREARILFQTWNLDHVVERSRFIVPMCVEKNAENVDFELIFNDLFTTDNLKLVHIVCHDKNRHESAKSNYDLTDNINENKGGDSGNNNV